eukprot:scaffold292256_cov28-Tisochrysis_lutea.AAC.1
MTCSMLCLTNPIASHCRALCSRAQLAPPYAERGVTCTQCGVCGELSAAPRLKHAHGGLACGESLIDERESFLCRDGRDACRIGNVGAALSKAECLQRVVGVRVFGRGCDNACGAGSATKCDAQ